jgi:hypothetical protein
MDPKKFFAELTRRTLRRRTVRPSSKSYPKLRPAKFRNTFCERNGLPLLRSKRTYFSRLLSTLNP